MRFVQFIILVFLATGIYSQDFTEIFKNDLPQSIFLTNEVRAEIQNEFIEISKINPVLLGYYIEHINLRFRHSNFDRAENKFNLFMAMRYNIINQRNDFIENEILLTEEKIKDRIELENVIDYLESMYIKNEIPKTFVDSGNIDQNLIYYYAYKMVSRNSKISFNPNENYLPMYSLTADSIKSILERNIKNPKNNVKEKIAFAQHYYYLFESADKKFSKNIYNKHLFDYLSHFTLFDARENGNLGIAYGNVLNLTQITISSTISGNSYISETSNFAFTFGVFGKIKLREKVGLFSHIRINAEYLIGLGMNNIENDFSQNAGFTVSETEGENHYILPHVFKGASDEKTSGYSFSISAPIYFFTNELFISGGISSLLINGEYKLNAMPDFPEIYPELNYFGAVYKKRKLLAFPLVTLNYQVFDYISIEVKYIAPVTTAFSIGIQYSY